MGGFDIFGRHPNPTARFKREALTTGRHEPATGNTQIERLIETLGIVLRKDILTGDTQVRCTIFNISRNVTGPDDQELEALAIRGQNKFPALVGIDCRLNADAPKESDRFVVDTSFREGQC
jgi:hypothetical protein